MYALRWRLFPHRKCTVPLRDDEPRLYFGMLFHDLRGPFVAEHHEGGGVGICGGAVGGENGDTQQVGAFGPAGARVEDVGVAHAVLLEVVAVVAARGHGAMVG